MLPDPVARAPDRRYPIPVADLQPGLSGRCRSIFYTPKKQANYKKIIDKTGRPQLDTRCPTGLDCYIFFDDLSNSPHTSGNAPGFILNRCA